MMAVDTSSLRRFLAGQKGRDVDAATEAIEHRMMVLPPVVLTEILSDALASEQMIDVLSALPLLELAEGYWIRAGMLRGKVIAAGHKSKVADALIAQSCLDHKVPLITHDRDFRHFSPFGLVLI